MHGFLDVNECDDEDGSEDGNDGDGCDSGNGRKLEGCAEGNGSKDDDACKCTGCEGVKIVEIVVVVFN